MFIDIMGQVEGLGHKAGHSSPPGLEVKNE